MAGLAASYLDNPPEGWQFKKFGAILAEPVRNGIYKKKEFHGRGHKIVNMGELFALDLISRQEMKRIALNDRERSKYVLEDGDLLFARRSLVLEGSGKCSLVVHPPEEVTFESSIIRARLNKEEASPRFYLYLWNSPLGQALRASIATRTAVSGIRGSDLVQLEVPVPPLPTQRKIAAILSAYDDLIENNTRRIAVLEEMAQLLYREWFVHFRFPGHESVRFVDSEFGAIPEDWEVRPVSTLCEYVSRGVTPKYAEGSSRYVINQKANRGSYIDTSYLKELAPELSVPEEKLAHERDLLVNSLGEGTLGRVHYFTGPHKEWAVDQHMSICRAFTPGVTLYLYLVLASDEGQARIESLKTGATNMTMFNISRLRAFEVVFPEKPLLKRFYGLVQPMYDMKRALEIKSANLRSARDFLLPRLISGRLDVADLDIDTGILT